MKRIMSLILAVLFIISLSTVSFADDLQDKFLEDMADGLKERWNLTSNVPKPENELDHLAQLAAVELDHIEKYQSEEFQNGMFDLLAKAYIEGCQLQQNSLKYYKDRKDLYNIQWNAGTQQRAACIVSMYDYYGLNVPNERVEEFRTLLNGGSMTIMPKGTTGSSNNVSGNPWKKPLPDGITATMQLFDEDTVLLVRYKNNTGKDISIVTSYNFFDMNGRGMQNGWATRSFFGNGTEYIAILNAPDVIASYQLDCEINDVYKKPKEANDALSVTSNRNSDGSVSAVFSSPMGGSVSGEIFFLDDNSNVISYQHFGIGFRDSMNYTFDSPGVEYSDYLLCYYENR